MATLGLKLRPIGLQINILMADWFSTYHVPGTVLRTLHMLTHLVLTTTSSGRYYYHLHFLDGKTETQTVRNILRVTQKQRFEARQANSGVQLLTIVLGESPFILLWESLFWLTWSERTQEVLAESRMWFKNFHQSRWGLKSSRKTKKGDIFHIVYNGEKLERTEMSNKRGMSD